MQICTIIAKNYVAQARVLARSFARHHPGGRCTVLVIDDHQGHIDPAEEPFELVTPEQIGCLEFEEMATRYDVLELSTAVKPWLLAYLLEDQGAPAITYLDPDIEVHSSLERLDELAGERGLVLTPHNTVPLPDDGKRPNQLDILLAGVYNLGYVSLGAGDETSQLLQWWRERLLNDCRVDPLGGYFVDQRWFDLAPGLVSDCVVMREPGYNLAYWNLHSRVLEKTESGYVVDGQPLAFFHYSGFDPERPATLSRHQSRIEISPGTALHSICRGYADALFAEGFHETSSWSYSFHTLPSGAKFTRRLRALYEIALERGEVSGSPFSVAGDRSFMSWLAEPSPGAPAGVNRLLAALYGERTDLQGEFPDVGGADHAAFLSWAAQTGVVEEPALGLLPSPAVATAPDPAPSPSMSSEPSPSVLPAAARGPGWGVNVVGYFRSELGTGEAARQVVSALDEGSIPLLPIHGRTIPPNRQGHAFTHLSPADAWFPVNLICMNADVLGEFAEQVGPGFFANRYSVGMWFWEVERFPSASRVAFDHVDELWLPTEHIISAVGPGSPVPVTKIVLPVEMGPVMPASRSELDLPEGFMFLFSFDHHSVFERKNPLAVVEAYKQAFDGDEGAVLVVKSINGDRAPEEHRRLVEAAGGRSDIHIIDGYLEPARKNMLVNSCDCYVSLHRAEGFGLTMAEAMYLGKPVVATAYSGNLDFMTAANSYLVDYSPVGIGDGAPPYPADADWAEPDVPHAARLMREVFDDRVRSLEIGARASEDIRRTHSAKAAAAVMTERLELLRESHHARLRAALAPLSNAAGVEQLAREGTPVAAPSRFGGSGRLLRRLVLRAIKPYRVRQQLLDRHIGEALAASEARLAELEAESVERHAGLLAELRRDEVADRIERRVAGLTRSTLALESIARETRASVDQVERESHAIPFMQDAPFLDLAHPLAGVVQGFRDGEGEQDAQYRSFEDTFRGSEELIRERQQVFLGLVRDHGPVFDLGCGRGEFLDLLAEAGIESIGVDSDPGMVERCREKGHTQVVLGDGLELLARRPDGSLGAIFCAQVIEHLPFGDLLRLFELAKAKLRPEGRLIAETVNPHSVPALKTFWVDPTHQHPIFPEVTLALARSAGFEAAFVFHPNGTGDFRRDRFTQGEYALVAGDAFLLEDAGAQAPATGRQVLEAMPGTETASGRS
jgi:glycosyltransferase involved in cell wall biosynthesis/SAM-dependent methyltransferase